MADPPTIADSGAGAVFSVSAADWTAINKRVGMVALAGPVAADMTALMPAFPQLQAVCGQWSEATFPGLIAEAAQVSALAASASATLEAVQALIPSHGGQTLPADTARAIRARFGALAGEIAPVAARVKDLCARVHAFADANSTVDAQAQAVVERLGDGWQCLGAHLTDAQAAAGSAEGAWSALCDDVDALGSGTIPITMPLLMSLAIGAALSSWRNIGSEARAFAAEAPALTAYFTDPTEAAAEAEGED